MTELSIDLEPDALLDGQARRGALDLLAAAAEGTDDAAEHDRAGDALQALLAVVIGYVEVRPESAPALSSMLSTVARQHSAFAAVAYALAEQAFRAGQADPTGDEPDYVALLAAATRDLEQY